MGRCQIGVLYVWIYLWWMSVRESDQGSHIQSACVGLVEPEIDQLPLEYVHFLEMFASDILTQLVYSLATGCSSIRISFELKR